MNIFIVICILFQSVVGGKLDSRWNTGILPDQEIVRIKEKLQNVTYVLRNRSKNEWVHLHQDDPIPPSLWHPGGFVKLIIHGYCVTRPKMTSFDYIDEQNIWSLGQEYVDANATLNVIVVDWTVLAVEGIQRYYEAAESTRYLGEYVAQFLIRLIKESLIPSWDHIHLIGLSLGGHTVGVIGYTVQQLESVKIGRITGLDPAGPNFSDENGQLVPENLPRVLDKSDAKFVDVYIILHCNMKLPSKSMVGRLGTFAECGHADFYPNGGESQTMCTRSEDVKVSACSHLQCANIMKNTIRNPRVACPCPDWTSYKNGKCKCTLETGGVYFGDLCSSEASGKYYITST